MEEEPGKTPAVKPKIGLKRIKKKPNLNISKGNLKSISTPKKFSFLNVSVQKQSLRANNRALAQSLSKARLDLRTLNAEHQDLKVFNQDLIQELNKLKRLVGIKDDELEEEVQKRMQAHVKDIRSTLEELSQNMLQSSVIVSTLNESCMKFARRSTASSRADSLGNVSTVSDGSLNRSSLNQRSSAAIRNKKQNSLMMKYLSNADEFSPPPCVDSPTFTDKANMSVVVEEPTAYGGFLSSVQQISPVSENPVEVLPKTSHLPQRVPKDKKIAETQPADKGEKVSSNSEDRNKKAKRPIIKANERRSGDYITAISNTELGILDIDSDFTADLVSASPIHKRKSDHLDDECGKETVTGVRERTRRDTFVLDKETNRTESCNKKEKKEPKTSKLGKVKSDSKLNKESSKIKPSDSEEKGLSLKKKGSVVTDKIKNKETLKVKQPTSAIKSLTPKSKAIEVPDIILEPGMPSNVDHFNPFKPSKTLLRSPHKSNTPSPELSTASPVTKVDSLQFLASLTGPNERTSETAIETSNFADDNTIYFNSEMELTAVCDIGKLLQSSKNVPKKSPYSSPAVGNNDKLNSKIDTEVTDDSVKSTDHSCRRSDKNEKSDSLQKDSADIATIEMRNKKPGVFTFSVGRKETDGTRKPIPEKPGRSRAKRAKNVTPEKEERKVGDDRDMFNFGDRTPTMPLEKILQTKNVYDLSMNDSSIAPTSSLSNFIKTSLKDKVSSSDAQQKNGNIYNVPLKDSPNEKKVTKRSGRSKSNTRSKSRSRQDHDSEDEWVPEKKARSRSCSKARKTKKQGDNEEEPHVTSCPQEKSSVQSSELTSGTQSTGSESAVVDLNDQDKHVYSVPLKKGSPECKTELTSRGRSRAKSNTRSKSKASQEGELDEEVLVERQSRSRSKKVHDKDDAYQDGNSALKNQQEPSEEQKDIYYEPLKDSPNVKSKQVTNRKRSKSNTRSKSKTRQECDSEDEMMPEKKERSRSRVNVSQRKKPESDDDNVASSCPKEKSNTVSQEGGSNTGSREVGQKDGHIDSDLTHQKDTNASVENKEGVYYEPVKDSPDEKSKKVSQRNRSKSRTRSKSKTRQECYSEDDEVKPERKCRSKNVHDVEFDGKTSHEDDKHNLDIKLRKVTKKNRSTSKTRQGDDSDEEVVTDRRSRSEEKAHDEAMKKVEDVYYAPLNDSPNEKSKKVTKRTRSKSKSRQGDNSDDEVITESESRTRGKKVADKEAMKKVEDVYYEPLKDSSNEKSKKVTQRKRSKSRSRSKFTFQLSDSEDNSETCQQDLAKDTDKNIAMPKPETNGIVDDPSSEVLEKQPLQETSSDYGVPEKKRSSKKVTEESEVGSSSRLSAKTPATSSTKASSKSAVSKSSRKRGVAVKLEEDTPRRKKEKVDMSKKEVLENSEIDSSPRLSTKTPAVAKSSKKSSKSTVSKSRRKRDDMKEEEHTPRKKKEKQDLSEQKENTPTGLSTLELLKKRLTMVTSRTSNINVDVDRDSRKLSGAGHGENDAENEGESEGISKSRRNKSQVSYVPKPLNAKLRRGDSLFDGQGSKAKADEMRLQLAKKTSVLRDFKN